MPNYSVMVKVFLDLHSKCCSQEMSIWYLERLYDAGREICLAKGNCYCARPPDELSCYVHPERMCVFAAMIHDGPENKLTLNLPNMKYMFLMRWHDIFNIKRVRKMKCLLVFYFDHDHYSFEIRLVFDHSLAIKKLS